MPTSAVVPDLKSNFNNGEENLLQGLSSHFEPLSFTRELCCSTLYFHSLRPETKVLTRKLAESFMRGSLGRLKELTNPIWENSVSALWRTGQPLYTGYKRSILTLQANIAHDDRLLTHDKVETSIEPKNTGLQGETLWRESIQRP